MNEPHLDRRAALRLFGGVGLGALVAGCGGGSSGSSASRSTTTRARGATSTTLASGASGSPASCVLAPEMTEGPFYLDLNAVRSDITDGRLGAALALALAVVDASTCAPVSNAAVDIWHADAGGVYSGFDRGSGRTFLRGTQITGADGNARFTTIYPGWYRGRAVHIHIKVHTGGDVVHTGQLFFPDDFTSSVYRRSPYSSRGEPDLRNADDDIYRNGGARSTLAPTASGDGYASAMSVGIRAA